MSEPLSPRTDRAIAVTAAVALFAVYAAGACRTIYVGDSGELVTAVHVLGIPHPSGYPLYVLLGKLWTILVPVGSIAFRMSLFSAACAAAACALLFVTVRQDGGSRVAGMFAAGLLAFGPSFWHEANIQRVYALNALFVILALNRALAWHRDRRPRDLVTTMLICGLGATNHTVMALVGVAVAMWAPIVEPSLFRKPKLVGACATAFAVGLLPYAYLPIRARMDPVLNWGEPKTLEAFLDVVLRRDFWHRAWWEGPADLGPILLDFAKSLGPETGYAGAALAMLAVAAGPWRRSLLPLLVISVNVAAMAVHGSYYDIFVWHRYYIPGYLVLAFLSAHGVDLLARQLGKRTVAGALAIPVAMLAVGWTGNDRSRHRVAEDFARLVLDSIPPGAKLLTRDDNILFSLLYFRYVEGRRPDVELIAEGVDQRKPPLFFNPDHDAVFFTHLPTWTIDGLSLAPQGVVFRAVRSETAPLPPRDVPLPTGLDDPTVPRDFLTRSLISHYWFMAALTWETWDWTKADEALRRSERVAADQPMALYNVAIVRLRNGEYDDAIRLLELAGRVDRHGIVQGVDPDTRERRRILPDRKADEARVERARIRALEARLAARISPDLATSSEAWHTRMAELLELAGEIAAARAHRHAHP